MTDNVKKFIEENIEAINDNDYKAVFDNWYDKYFLFDVDKDALQLRELFNIFIDAGIAFEAKSEEARKQVIKEGMLYYINDERFMESDYATRIGAIKSLHSRLGFGIITLSNLFIELCEEQGLEFVDSIKSKVKL